MATQYIPQAILDNPNMTPDHIGELNELFYKIVSADRDIVNSYDFKKLIIDINARIDAEK